MHIYTAASRENLPKKFFNSSLLSHSTFQWNQRLTQDANSSPSITNAAGPC